MTCPEALETNRQRGVQDRAGGRGQLEEQAEGGRTEGWWVGMGDYGRMDVGGRSAGGYGNPLQYSCLESPTEEPGGLQ